MAEKGQRVERESLKQLKRSPQCLFTFRPVRGGRSRIEFRKQQQNDKQLNLHESLEVLAFVPLDCDLKT